MNSMRMNIEEYSRAGRGRSDRGPGPRPGPEHAEAGFGPQRRNRPDGRRGHGPGHPHSSGHPHGGGRGDVRAAVLALLGERPRRGDERHRDPQSRPGDPRGGMRRQGRRWERPDTGTAPAHQALRDGVGRIAAAARQVAGTGTAEQKDQAAQVLAAARSALYRLLADGA